MNSGEPRETRDLVIACEGNIRALREDFKDFKLASEARWERIVARLDTQDKAMARGYGALWVLGGIALWLSATITWLVDHLKGMFK